MIEQIMKLMFERTANDTDKSKDYGSTEIAKVATEIKVSQWMYKHKLKSYDVLSYDGGTTFRKPTKSLSTFRSSPTIACI